MTNDSFMPSIRLSLPLISFFLIILLAAQCQPTSTPAPVTNDRQTPTVRLIPPIEPGDGSDLIDALLERGVLRVGVRVWPAAEFSPPAFRGFSNAATGGALNGFEIDVARLLATGLGLELELVEAYPPVINSGDWQKRWDIALATLTPFDPAADQKGQALLFSQPYGYLPLGILIPDRADDLETLGQLSGRAIGVLEHSAYEQLLNANGAALRVQNRPLRPDLPADLHLVPVSNLAKAIQHLAGQELDTPTERTEFEAIFGPAPILQEAVKSGLAVKLATPTETIGGLPLAVAVVPQDNLKVSRLLEEINIILKRAHRRGTLAEIYLRWYGQDLSQAPSP